MLTTMNGSTSIKHSLAIPRFEMNLPVMTLPKANKVILVVLLSSLWLLPALGQSQTPQTSLQQAKQELKAGQYNQAETHLH